MFVLGIIFSFVLFVLQLTGLVHLSALGILAPVLVGVAVTALFWLIALLAVVGVAWKAR
jgi:hypothetical protein